MRPTLSSTASVNAINEAGKLLERGATIEALAMIDRVNNANLSSEAAAQAAYLRGRILIELVEYEAAVEPLRAACQIQKSNPVYRIALSAALHFLGDIEGAEKQCREAIRLAPTAENPHFNLATMLYQKGNYQAAVRAYEAAISRKANFVDALAGLANIYVIENKLALAEALLKRALLADPNSINALTVDACYDEKSGHHSQAIEKLQRALTIDAGYAESWFHLGRIKGGMGETEEAAACFEKALAIDPQNPQIQFMCRTYSVGNLPSNGAEQADKVPTLIVRDLFDQYASTFDESLVTALQYKTPEKIYAALSNWLNKASNLNAVLDLGCGTGLMGLHIAQHTNQLVGVDLSSKMLQKANGRGYALLHEASIERYLEETEPSQFNLIIAADVFVYVGDLQSIFKHIESALVAHGKFAFSTESLNGPTNIEPAQEYLLRTTGRYAHRSDYIMRIAKLAGLDLESVSEVVLRTDAGKDVLGNIYVLVKA